MQTQYNEIKVMMMGDTGIRKSVMEFMETAMEAGGDGDDICVACGHKRFNHKPKCGICDCGAFIEKR